MRMAPASSIARLHAASAASSRITHTKYPLSSYMGAHQPNRRPLIAIANLFSTLSSRCGERIKCVWSLLYL